MNNQRIEKLKELINEDPSDPFPRYGLAMELAKNSPQQAVEAFEQLLADFPTYLPSYYQAALAYLELGLSAKAKTVLQEGIALAQRNNEKKTKNELQSQLDSLED